jgi:hypothetical protein
LFGAVAPWSHALLGVVVALIVLGVVVLQFLKKRAPCPITSRRSSAARLSNRVRAAASERRCGTHFVSLI